MSEEKPGQDRREFLQLAGAAGATALAAGAQQQAFAQSSSSGGGTYDYVVAGGGHNGLVCAAYLAKAGYSVVVLEAKDAPGGNTASERLTGDDMIHEPCAESPGGLRGAAAFHELELEKYGVEFVPQGDLVAHNQFLDGENLPLWHDRERTAAEIERFSRRDASSYLQMLSDFENFGPVWGPWEDTPIGYGPSLAERFAARADGATWMRRMRQSGIETVDEYFRDEHVRAWVLAWLTPARLPFDQYGTGVNVGPFLNRQRHGLDTMVGGLGALPAALIRLLAEHDCEVQTNKLVVQLMVENGKCVGVETADGETYRVRHGVLASIHPTQIAQIAPRDSLPEEFVSNLRQYKPCPLAMFTAHYAVKEAITFQVGEEWRAAPAAMFIGSEGEQLEQMAAARMGRVVERSAFVGFAQLSLYDRTRTPSGGETIKLITLYPYDLEDGGPARWDAIKGQVAQTNLEIVRSFSRNFEAENVTGQYLQSPLDVSGRNINNVGGTCHGGAETLAQIGEMRPVFGWASHKMPIDGFYLTGSASHPGGSVCGSPGRNAAWVALHDQGKTIEEVVGKA